MSIVFDNEPYSFIDVREQSLYENNRIYVYRVLKDNILKLKLEPGEKISEVKIKNIFKVSRSPIREAIVRLTDESLIDVFPQKGTYVSLLDQKIIENSLFMRSAIEKEIMKIVCSKDFNTNELIDNLENIFAKQKKISNNYMKQENIKLFFNLNEEFHKIIYKYVDKEIAFVKIRSFDNHYSRFHLLESLAKTNVHFAIEQHTKNIESIKSNIILAIILWIAGTTVIGLPVVLTVATELLFVDHVNCLFVAFVGLIVAVNVSSLLSSKVNVVLFNVIDVTKIADVFILYDVLTFPAASFTYK